MPLADHVPSRASGGTRRVVVFACGDPLRGDDSVAHVACRALPPAALARADVILTGALEPEHVRGLAAGTRAIVVDAVVGPAPGELVEMELEEMGRYAESVVTTSTHQLPLDQVVAIGQLLRDEPVMGRFVGLAIESVEVGREPGGSVAASVADLTAAVLSQWWIRHPYRTGQDSPAHLPYLLLALIQRGDFVL